jgi:hypothetical protein
MISRRVQLHHTPGNCREPHYGANCDGIARWQVNPYIEELYGEREWEFICDGVYTGMSMDI